MSDTDATISRDAVRDAPVTAVVRQTDAQELVGRKRECAELDRLLDDARHGQSGSRVVRGGAGMGKTALLRYAARRARDLRVLRTTGIEAEHDLAFAGLHALLWPILDSLQHVPEPQRRALSSALGLADGEGRDRFLVSAGVLSLLAAAAEERSLLCVVDDAHWLDVPSAGALEFTARRLAVEGVALLIGTRDVEDERFNEPALRQLVLDPLDRRSALTVLDRGSPQVVPPVRERLLSEAHGNPLALVELPAALSDAQLAGRAPLPQALPLTARLRVAFTTRLTRLPVSTQTLLLLASAENTGDLQVIRRAADRSGLPGDALGPAEQAGLVGVESGTLTFRHPLLRSAVYESVPVAQRQWAHVAVAESLEIGQQSDRALWHRAMATDRPNEQLAEALEASARHSERRGGHASAASAFERAAEVSETEGARGRRLALAAEAAWGGGQADRSRALVQRSLPLANDAGRVRLLYLSGVIEGRRGRLEHGIAALHKAAMLSEDETLSLQMLREAAAMAIYAADYATVITIGANVAPRPRETDIDRYIGAAIGAFAADLSG